MKQLSFFFFLLLFLGCKTLQQAERRSGSGVPFDWKGANLYFLLTDRFNNGNPSNDNLLARNKPTGVLRGFTGGDISGVTKKIEEGYFSELGVNAIWLTPIVEQIHGSVDEGTGNSYGYHGYWTKDWTAIDPNFGTEGDLKELVEKAHAKGIRIVLDAVVNHTGPVTALDPVYPSDWVRTGPKCTYDSYKNTIECTLVENLPDVKTESKQEVSLPPMLVEKWKKEGRYEQETASLDEFFKKTGYPRSPRYYIMKWLADYIRKYGIDGYRVDTAKHTTEDVWSDFNKICQAAFAEYKANNPGKVLDNNEFFLMGEVFGYGPHGGQWYDFGDKKVNYFENGFGALINFDFKNDAGKDFETLFSHYSEVLHNELKDCNIANYLTSHDDGQPFDRKRNRTYEAAIKLILTPGISQIYYGDETARPLETEGARGDANLRSPMDWKEVVNSKEKKQLLQHYCKLGQFRAAHPAVGAGIHHMISAKPYVFERIYSGNGFHDQVVIGLYVPVGEKIIPTGDAYKDGDVLYDSYSGEKARVKGGQIKISTPFDLVLLAKQ